MSSRNIETARPREKIETPQAMVDSLLLVIERSTDPKDREWARGELVKTMKIAYARWYPDKPEYQINGGDSKVLVDQDTGRIELAKHIKIPDLFFPSQWLMNQGGERTKEMRYTPKYVDKIMKEYGKMVRECWNIAHALKAHIVGAG